MRAWRRSPCGAVMVALGRKKHLGLERQAAKSLGMENPIAIALVARAHVVFRLGTGTPPRRRRQLRRGYQCETLFLLQFFANVHKKNLVDC